MADPTHLPDSQLSASQLSAPGVPVIRNINWGGLSTLYVKEVRRFFKVQLQTVWAPAVSQLLLLVVFTTALGARGAVSVGGVEVPFGTFIAPGLIVMVGWISRLRCVIWSPARAVFDCADSRTAWTRSLSPEIDSSEPTPSKVAIATPLSSVHV